MLKGVIFIKIKARIFIVLPVIMSGSASFALPPSINALNNIVDNLDNHIQVNNIIIDSDKNIMGFFARYDRERVMDVYRFRINSDGEIIEKPGILFSKEGAFMGLSVIRDKAGNIHMPVSVISDCEWDEYLMLNEKGTILQSIWPNTTVSCNNIISDSVFIAFRIEHKYECEWLEDNIPNDLYYKIFIKFPKDTNFTLNNIPYSDLGCTAPILEVTPDNRIFAILTDFEKTGYYEYIYPTIFASLMPDLDLGIITSVNKGNIKDAANFVFYPIKENIGIDGTSTIWLGDSLIFYSRVRGNKEDYFHTSESLYVVIFNNNGDLLKSEYRQNGNLVYGKIDGIGDTEKLITYWLIESGKYKFGLISFKDFPKIYIDLGEE